MAFKRKVKRDNSLVGYAWEVRWEDANGKERQKTFPIKADPEDAKDAGGRSIKPRPVEKIAKAADRFCVEVELELAKGNTTTPSPGPGHASARSQRRCWTPPIGWSRRRGAATRTLSAAHLPDVRRASHQVHIVDGHGSMVG